jgi:hypothetical protein
MTTPDERVRAIGWGAETLQELQQDKSVPASLREDARTLSVRYPRVSDLVALVDTGAREFPVAAGSAIESARLLFEHVQLGSYGSTETRRRLLYTLRHFPLRGWAVDAANAARLGELDSWLAPSQQPRPLGGD